MNRVEIIRTLCASSTFNSRFEAEGQLNCRVIEIRDNRQNFRRNRFAKFAARSIDGRCGQGRHQRSRRERLESAQYSP